MCMDEQDQVAPSLLPRSTVVNIAVVSTLALTLSKLSCTDYSFASIEAIATF